MPVQSTASTVGAALTESSVSGPAAGGGPFLRGGALSRGHGTSPVTAGRRLRLLSANTASASSSDQTNGHRNLALGVYFHSICRLQ